MPPLTYTLDMIGVAVFAVSGALAAGKKKMDLIGVMVLALVTAVGGGTTRDVLLGRHPIFWLRDGNYLFVILASALLTVGVARWHRPHRVAMLVADALGLALFSVVGAQIAERQGLPAIAAVLLGTATGSAGGVVRDVLSGEVPALFQGGNLYATAAIAGISAYLALEAMGVPRGQASLVGMAAIALLRFAALRWELRLPVFHLEPTSELPVPRELRRGAGDEQP
ncbi:MAG TPA: trimeric intracellular cation channel family protein [Gemmatimonadaceae bacterium]